MTRPAHQAVLQQATEKTDPGMIPVSSVASFGHPLADYDNVDKVRRMRRKLRAGGELPPIRVTPLTPELRDRYGVDDASKAFYLDAGHHRLAATKLEGRRKISAVDHQSSKRI